MKSWQIEVYMFFLCSYFITASYIHIYHQGYMWWVNAMFNSIAIINSGILVRIRDLIDFICEETKIVFFSFVLDTIRTN